jgi:hypothetical protein
LWNDEAWTAWAVRSPDVRDMLARVRGDVHPPLYFVALYGWVRTVGESAFSLRLLSALFSLIGLAGTYALGKRLFDAWTAGLGLVILATASFLVYYAREARMYSLLLALSALATWTYWRWVTRPTVRRGLSYGLLLAALLYTHYAGAIIIITHLMHRGLLARRRPVPSLKSVAPCGLALALFTPWLPTLLNQMRANPNGPLAIPLPTDWGTVAGLVLIVTSGYWGLLLAPFVLGEAIPRLRQYGRAVSLLVVWLLLTPLSLLALNAWAAPVYQVRYTIASLPAGALFVAYGLRHIGFDRPARVGGARLRSMLTLLWLLILAYTQLTSYSGLWPDKPPWEATIAQMLAARTPLEPIITDFAPYSPAAYYDGQLGIRRGLALDLSWRLHTAAEIHRLAQTFEGSPAVWAALPVNTAKTWHLVAHLSTQRRVGYRASLVNMIFYRFDRGDGSGLRFRFGDTLRYESGPGADQIMTLGRGQQVCADFQLQALKPLDGSLSAGLHLVDITGNTTLAQHDAGIGTASAGDRVTIQRCMSVPQAGPPGSYHLELVIYNWATLQRLPIIEDGAGDGVGWGDVLMLAAVEVN